MSFDPETIKAAAPTLDVVAGQPWFVGALVATIVALAGVITFLFRRSDKRDLTIEEERSKIIEERASWITDREKIGAARELDREELRAEFEEKHRVLVEHYLQQARADREADREHALTMQKEYAEIMETVSGEMGKSSQALVEVLTKFHDRFVGPRRH